MKETLIRDYSLLGVEAEKAVAMGLADAEWYQSPIPKAQMKELLVRKDGPAIRDTLIWFGLLLGSAYLTVILWGSWWAVVPYIIYSVLYASSSDSRWHESSHGTAFKTDWMNNALYEISSFMVFRQSTVWKWSHARHHSDTIIRGRDPEIAVPRPTKLRNVLLTFFGFAAIPEMKKLLVHASGRIDPEVATYVPESEYPKVIYKARIYLAIFVFVIALAIIYQTILPLLFVGLPTLFGSWLMPVYGYTQHAGLDENVLDHRLNSRTVYMNRIHRFLYWNMNYHVEHHMFPLVPYHALPKLHELMKDDCPKPYNSIYAAFREIIPAIWKQRKDPTYFVQRELPVTAGREIVVKQHIFTGNDIDIINGEIAVCSVDKLNTGEAIRFDLGNRTYALYQTETGEYFATDGMCTHGNAHLSDGMIIGDMIECPKHNGRFGLQDGLPMRDPVCVKINTYAVKVENGRVYLQLPKKDVDKELSKSYTYKVVSNQNLTPFIKELVLTPIEAPFSYFPGQYTQLEIPPHNIQFSDFEIDMPYATQWDALQLSKHQANNPFYVQRNYSMAGNPAQDELLRFNIRIAVPPEGLAVPAGSGSSYVFLLKEGDKVKLNGAHGDFLIQPGDKEMVYVGAGAGMAPLRAHLSYLFETMTTKRKVSFWYGARQESDLFYLDYFEALAKAHANFSFHTALSQPETNWSGNQGYIQEVFFTQYLQAHPDLTQIEFYLCGPPAMVAANRELLQKLQVPPHSIFSDEF